MYFLPSRFLFSSPNKVNNGSPIKNCSLSTRSSALMWAKLKETGKVSWRKRKSSLTTVSWLRLPLISPRKRGSKPSSTGTCCTYQPATHLPRDNTCPTFQATRSTSTRRNCHCASQSRATTTSRRNTTGILYCHCSSKTTKTSTLC